MSLNIQKSLGIDAPAATVFDALTVPAKILSYFPVEKVDVDPKIDGVITIHGNAGEIAFTDHGIIEQITRPDAFRYRYWSTNHGTDRLPENYMTIDYRIEQTTPKSVVLHLEHSNLLTEERLSQMAGVWDFLLSQLKAYCEGEISE